MPNERGLRESGFFVAETVDRLGSGSRTPADVARSVRAGDGTARHRADQRYAVSRGRDIVRAARRRLCLGFRSEAQTSDLQSLMRNSYAVSSLQQPRM